MLACVTAVDNAMIPVVIQRFCSDAGGAGIRVRTQIADPGLMSVSATNIVVRVSGPDGDSAGHDYTVFRPFLVGLNYHLTPSSRADLYLGPLVSYVFYEDIMLQYGSEDALFEIDDDFAFGAALGLDLYVGAEGHWSLNASLRYLETSVGGVENGEEPFELDYDPLILGFGFGYRF